MKKNYKHLEIWTKKKISGDFLWIFNSFLKWAWVEFDSLREYEFWDSIKNIDWKKTAKQNKVFVKNYEKHQDLDILFIIENTESLNFGSELKTKKQTLQEIFCLLAYSCIAQGCGVWAFINNVFLNFKKQESIVLSVLSYLDTLNKDKININSFFIDNKLKNKLIFYICDNLEIDFAKLKYLSIKNEVIFINIFDYFENNLSSDDFDLDILWTKNIFGIFNNQNKKIDYIKSRKQNLENLNKQLKKQKISYLKIDSRQNVFLELYRFINEYKK